MSLDFTGRLRWSTNAGEPLLFMKYSGNKLNLLDVEKKALTLNEAISLDDRCKETLFYFFFHLLPVNHNTS